MSGSAGIGFFIFMHGGRDYDYSFKAGSTGGAVEQIN